MTGFAKKSLFTILRPMLEGAAVLDLYCGTGTLGLEALSNGASWCGFAERDPKVIRRLMANIDTCQAGSVTQVWTGYVERQLPGWLADVRQAGREVDIAFLDPPYADARQWRWDELIAKVFMPLSEAMQPNGIAVLRLPGDVPTPDDLGPLTLQRTKDYGQMMVGFYGMTNEEV
jgi:16S rRNA (guanine(966)-N(2))-methyltransferase RsmD